MIIKDNYIFRMGDGMENAVHVKQGEIVIFDARDGFNNQIPDESYVMDRLDWSGVNPATGPVYIEGAEKGDVLKVEIIDIDVAPEGTMCALPDSGVLGADVEKSEAKKVKIVDGCAIFDDFKIPVKPMIGVIGVAPEGEPIPCGVPGNHGGNMDNTKIAKGATLYLPVFHDGAYLSCGDCHAGMGDGEIMVTGVEIPAKISLRFEVVRGKSIKEPRLEDDECIYTISSDIDIEKAIYSATKTMAEILGDKLGYSLNKAGMLISLAGNLQFCQVVDPALTVRMAVPKEICDKVL